MPMKREDVEAWLKRHSYASRPAYPHIFYRMPDDSDPVRLYRYRITTHGLRRETRLTDGTWSRVRSAYFKNLSLSEDDKLQGMSIKGM